MLIKTAEQNFCDIADATREALGSELAYRRSEIPTAITEAINPFYGISYTFDDSGNPLTATVLGYSIRGLAGAPASLSIIYDDVTKITDIGPYAFYCSAITDYTVPDTVQKIRKYAFAESSIKNITLPNGLETIEDYAFAESDITNVTFPSNLKTIGAYAFSKCDNLALTKLPDSITIIGAYAFYGSDRITSLTLPKNLTTIEEYAFEYMYKLTTVTFQSKPTKIASDVFYYAKLTTLNVPWAEGEVEGAPWGATNATINYNYTG